MRNQIGIDTLANWVSMLRADIDGAIVLVDSDSEGQFYEKCTHQTARVVPSPNTALPLLELIQARQVRGVVATVTGPTLETIPAESVFQPSLGDVASLLLTAQCCEGAVEEIGGTIWLRACNKEVGSLVDRIVSLAWSIYNERLAAKTSESPTHPTQLVDWSTLTLVSNEKLQATANVGAPVPVGGSTIRHSLLAECDGMLAMELLAQAMTRFQPRGLRANRQCSASELLSLMRLSFDLAELEVDPIYWRMRAWERGNKRFPLLRHWRLLDPLQVVLDQRYWESDLRVMLDEAQSADGMAAFKLDLDNFKMVNEKLGHAGGDEAIKLACGIVKSVLGGVGEVYRRGGDEIVVLAPGLTEANAVALAEELRRAVADSFAQWGSPKGLDRSPTASIGLVNAARGSQLAQVTLLLDEAQATAKQQGKDRVVVRNCPAE